VNSAPEPTGIRLGVARGISFGLFGPTEDIIGPSRALGAGVVRVFLYWNQVEPRPGAFDWGVVDALAAQLTGEEEVWLTVGSSSSWGTRTRSDFLPSSPAVDDAAYERFVRALVARLRGKVRYWQCGNEPSNTGLLWAGSAEEYAAQLRRFHRAVRDADPTAAVVLGGCGYDVLSSTPDGEPRRFFARVLELAADAYDLFSVHLYDNPARIPDHLATVRAMMRAHGPVRPVVVGECNGPTLFEAPELEPVLQRTMAAAFSPGAPGDLSTGGLATSAATETPERRAMRALYASMAELPPQLQMFMAGCPAELDAHRDRINVRQVVTRNLYALSCGVRRTVCWQLAPEVSGYEDPFTMMELMHGKLALLGYEGRALVRWRPAAHAFRRLAEALRGVERVERVDRVDAEGPPGVVVVSLEGDRCRRRLVAWREGDTFAGEDEPTARVSLPWRPGAGVHAVDALGAAPPVEAGGGRLRLDLGVTPVFLDEPTVGGWAGGGGPPPPAARRRRAGTVADRPRLG
jgi:hypothetical protein